MSAQFFRMLKIRIGIISLLHLPIHIRFHETVLGFGEVIKALSYKALNNETRRNSVRTRCLTRLFFAKRFSVVMLPTLLIPLIPFTLKEFEVKF